MGERAVVIYEAYHLRIDSEVRLPIPPSTGPPDVEVRFRAVDMDGVAFAPIEGVGDEGAVWVVDMGWDGDRVVIRFPDLVAELCIDPPAISLDNTVSPDEDLDVDWLAHLVLDHVIPRWLALRGDLVLHAGSVVAPSGAAVAFIGETGQGKSSTVTGLARAGWPLLGDDACRVVRYDDRWRAFPSYPGVRLISDSRRVLAPGIESTPMAVGADKRRVLPDVPLAVLAAPLGLIVELGRNSRDVTTQRLTLSEATAALMRHGFHLAPTRAQLAPRAFELASAVAMAAPCVRMDFPRSWDVFPELVAALHSLGELAP